MSEQQIHNVILSDPGLTCPGVTCETASNTCSRAPFQSPIKSCQKRKVGTTDNATEDESSTKKSKGNNHSGDSVEVQMDTLSSAPFELWILEVHRSIGCPEDDFLSDVHTFLNKEDAEFFLANYACDEIEFMLKEKKDSEYHVSDDARKILVKMLDSETSGKVRADIRGNLTHVKDVISDYDGHDKKMSKLCYLIDRSRIYTTYPGRALLRYTVHKPAESWDFDGYVLGIQEISREMDIFSHQLDHPEQQETCEMMLREMNGNIETLQSMLTYQDYLKETDTCEEQGHIDVAGALRQAKALVHDIERSIVANVNRESVHA